MTVKLPDLHEHYFACRSGLAVDKRGRRKKKKKLPTLRADVAVKDMDPGLSEWSNSRNAYLTLLRIIGARISLSSYPPSKFQSANAALVLS